MLRGKETFINRELCDRYGITAQTLRAWEKNRGYPPGDKFGKNTIRSVRRVIAWEQVHMPHLHQATEIVDEDPEQAAMWAREHQRHKEKAGDDEPPRPKRRPLRRKK